jgi:hypothetical protein
MAEREKTTPAKRRLPAKASEDQFVASCADGGIREYLFQAPIERASEATTTDETAAGKCAIV